MEKGRNLAILMAVLLAFSILAFLTRARTTNQTAVVDRVRYKLDTSDDNSKRYMFYFVSDEIMECNMSHDINGVYTFRIYYVEYTNKEKKEYTTTPYDYVYKLTGRELDDCEVTWEYYDEYVESPEEKPYERFSQELFKTMLYGKKPFVSIPQAITVALIAISGAFLIAKAEELWHFVNKKPPEEDPKWEELNVYKRSGVGVLILSGVLLIIFIVI